MADNLQILYIKKKNISYIVLTRWREDQQKREDSAVILHLSTVYRSFSLPLSDLSIILCL